MTTLIAKLLKTVNWQPIESEPNLVPDSELPQITHSGVLEAEGFELCCYKLADGEVSFDLIHLEGFFRGCCHCLTPGPCAVCHPPDDSIESPRSVVVLGFEEGST